MKKAIWIVFLGALAVGVYHFRANISNRIGGGVALINEAADPLKLPSLDGQVYSLEDYGGKVVVVAVWSTCCPAGVAFIERVEELHKDYKEKDVVILIVSLDDLGGGMSLSELRQFVADRGLTLPVLLLDQGTYASFATENTVFAPQFRVYDRNLRVRYKSTAASTATVQEVESVLERLLEQ